ncbi:cytochrome o ubiquinol oxidase subunit IV [Pseudooceanicola algae]|uniref:Cytochrome bo(3) ubiquinol oxidase subunit 4 n=1 Tax=Pseudooceanicola algae TaxID=1537215 RepID=A0A418SI90_9RHOB|nr:cytochrome o ubiquinol oxidase subunit IV [Pseudooceanicola algae]QPM90241.1 hypothetical protein PSAL_014760 [Pseudooceanicola algae]
MSDSTHSHGGAAHGGGGHGTLGRLMIGFGLAVILTVIPFYLVMGDVDLPRRTMIGIIMGLAAVQIIVHLVFFLHVNGSAEGGWTLAATGLAVVILGIVLAGSLWVMHNMNENMMPMPEGHDMMQMPDAPALHGTPENHS